MRGVGARNAPSELASGAEVGKQVKSPERDATIETCTGGTAVVANERTHVSHRLVSVP